MTIRIRPSRLGYIITSLTALVLFICLLATQIPLLSSDQITRLNILFSFESPMSFLYPRNQSIFTDPEASTNLQQNIIRITLAQYYEDARTSLLVPVDEEGESMREEEAHEDYIFRLSTFVLSHFKGSNAQEYLLAMLMNLNDHISPPLMRAPLRRGMIRIIDDDRKRRLPESEEWEMNVFDKQGMDRGLWALSKGSPKLEESWRNVTLPGNRKVLLKYLALCLWGGAYAEDEQVLKSMHLGSIARTASSALSPKMTSIRTELQSLAPAPPSSPEFVPLPLDPNWSAQEEPSALKSIGLIIHRRPGATWVDRFPLSTDTIMAKTFHPVFLDIVDRMNSQIEEAINGYGSAETFDDIRLFHDAVDRYLQVQYGTSLEDLIYRNQDLRIGDVLLLRNHA